VLFQKAQVEGLESGRITCTIRNWSRPQVKVGGIYRPWGLALEITSIERMPFGAVPAKLLDEADHPALDHLADDDLVYVIHFVNRPDAPKPPDLGAKDRLTDDDVADLDRRLAKMDANSSVGPWTLATLRIIGEQPGVVSTRLAEQLGRERFSFKADVRKLKKLGLTRSLEVGYELSPRGQAYLDRRTP
jgi:hypothetical protein